MNHRAAIARSISACVALLRAGRPARPGLRVLSYHAVGTRLSKKLDPFTIFSVDPSMFQRQMELLASFPDVMLVDLGIGVPSDQTLQVAVTFDDGFRDNLYTAAPVLQKLNISFTVFVTTRFIKSGAEEFLSGAELKELSMYPGATIGAHGETHSLLTECDDVRLIAELRDSRLYLEDLLGKPVTALSYPHGSVNSRVRAAAVEAGYTLGVCTYVDINKPGRDRLMLCRSIIRGDDSERVFQQKLHGDWDWYRWIRRDPITS